MITAEPFELEAQTPSGDTIYIYNGLCTVVYLNNTAIKRWPSNQLTEAGAFIRDQLWQGWKLC